MEAYLDNAATTQALEEVCQVMDQVMREDYGNPSSLHKKGLEAEHYIKHAREVIAATLKVEPKEIYFTSGGSESDNWAIKNCDGKKTAGKAYHNQFCGTRFGAEPVGIFRGAWL